MIEVPFDGFPGFIFDVLINLFQPLVEIARIQRHNGEVPDRI